MSSKASSAKKGASAGKHKLADAPQGSPAKKAAVKGESFEELLKQARVRRLLTFQLTYAGNTVCSVSCEKKDAFKTESAMLTRSTDNGHYRLTAFSSNQWARRALTPEQWLREGKNLFGKFGVVLYVAIRGMTHVQDGKGPTLDTSAAVEAYHTETLDLMAETYDVEQCKDVELTLGEMQDLLTKVFVNDVAGTEEFKRPLTKNTFY